MRYLDTGSRDPAQTLAKWLEEAVREEVAELRFQTGFFSLEGIGPLISTLNRCNENDLTTNILIGSNNADTLKDDVAGLVNILGIPRNGAQLGIVNFSGAYFHPKTYHIKRVDGSQAAFVGSANLTASGLALHVEAGIALDTNDGDDEQHLIAIASAIDRWFDEQRDGLILVSSLETLETMTEDGVLALTRPPRTGNQNAGTESSGRASRPRLQPLVFFPPIGRPAGQTTMPVGSIPVVPIGTNSSAQTLTNVATSNLPSVPRNNFPPYLLFAPNMANPTHGVSALTGASLPGGSAGLIIQLNRDSARHFTGTVGTANISIPVATLSTLRFGIYGTHGRPRAEFNLKLRYVSAGSVIGPKIANTNVMGYGFTATESGHADVRMLVPADVRALGRDVAAAGLPLPTAGDIALLEWPTASDPSFRLSFLDAHSSVSQQATALFNSALATGQAVGNGACWLAVGISPIW